MAAAVDRCWQCTWSLEHCGHWTSKRCLLMFRTIRNKDQSHCHYLPPHTLFAYGRTEEKMYCVKDNTTMNLQLIDTLHLNKELWKLFVILILYKHLTRGLPGSTWGSPVLLQIWCWAELKESMEPPGIHHLTPVGIWALLQWNPRSLHSD